MSAIRVAASIASLVLPTPPTPVIVSIRTPRSASDAAISPRSASRPTIVSGTGGSFTTRSFGCGAAGLPAIASCHDIAFPCATGAPAKLGAAPNEGEAAKTAEGAPEVGRAPDAARAASTSSRQLS